MVNSAKERQPEAGKNEYRLALDKTFANSRIDHKFGGKRAQQSRIALESTLFKENMKGVHLFSSKFPLPDPISEFQCSNSEEVWVEPHKTNIFLDALEENCSERSQSPQPRSFCQPVFEEEFPDEPQMKSNLEKKHKPNPPRKGEHSMLTMLLNNPLGEVSKKRRNEENSSKPSTYQVSGRVSTLKTKELGSKNLKAVKTTAVRSKTPLAVKDLNTQSVLRQSKAEGLTSQLTKNSKLGDYEVSKVIAKGSYSVVKQATQKATNLQVAIKFYENCKLNDLQKRAGINKEIAALKQLNHLNIIGLIEDFNSRVHTCIVMELTSTCTLYQYLKSKPERKLSCKGRPVLPRISFCLWQTDRCDCLYAFKGYKPSRSEARKHYLRWIWRLEAHRFWFRFIRKYETELFLWNSYLHGPGNRKEKGVLGQSSGHLGSGCHLVPTTYRYLSICSQDRS